MKSYENLNERTFGVSSREVITELADTGYLLRVLQAVNEGPVTATELERRDLMARETAQSWLATLVDRGWAERQGNQYESTVSGAIILQCYNQCLKAVDQEVIADLSRSMHKIEALRRLNENKEIDHLSDLWPEADESPSAPTVTRIRNDFEDRRWIERDRHRYRLTDSGERVRRAYNGLEKEIKQVMDKAPFLRRLGELSADCPLKALDDAEMRVLTLPNPHEGLDTAFELMNQDFSQIRGMATIFSPILYDAATPTIKADIDTQTLFDKTAYRELCKPQHMNYLANSFEARNAQCHDFRVHSEHLSFGLGIMDDVVGMSAHADPDDPGAVIISSNEQMYRWVEGIFERYWEQSRPPLPHVEDMVDRYAL
jgi:predicted transcriptional regulator